MTVNYHNHPLVAVASNPDLSTAIHAALEKMEKQAIKVRAKWRDGKRTPREQAMEAAPRVEPAAVANGVPRVYRVDNNQRHKPMTLDEAILEMEKDRDYLVYRDAENDRVSILVRRRDGHFDLVEC
jgi:putative sigma-54 modulation protein